MLVAAPVYIRASSENQQALQIGLHGHRENTTSVRGSTFAATESSDFPGEKFADENFKLKHKRPGGSLSQEPCINIFLHRERRMLQTVFSLVRFL